MLLATLYSALFLLHHTMQSRIEACVIGASSVFSLALPGSPAALQCSLSAPDSPSAACMHLRSLGPVSLQLTGWPFPENPLASREQAQVEALNPVHLPLSKLTVMSVLCSRLPPGIVKANVS